MLDFTAIAPALRHAADLEDKLRELGFHRAEELSPNFRDEDHADYSSEIWLRQVGDEWCQAVRIDWRGHPHLPGHYNGHGPHVHFETFPVSARSAYLLGPIPRGLVTTCSTETGLPLRKNPSATHGTLRVIGD